MGPPEKHQGVFMVSAGMFVQISLEIQLHCAKEYFPCLRCAFRLWFIIIIIIIATSPGLAVLEIVVTRVVALTLLICCQRQSRAHSQEKQKPGVQVG